MKDRFEIKPWSILETRFDPDDQRFSESLMSLGNGQMGLRGTFEEDFSGDTHRGAYLGGVWFPDKTRVGWWKNGYPQYFGKAINVMNWIGLHIVINGETLDAGKMQVLQFSRELNMKEGILRRNMRVKTAQGCVDISSERFVSIARNKLLALNYSLNADYQAEFQVSAYVDGRVINEDSNYSEIFWEAVSSAIDGAHQIGKVSSQTKANPFGTPRFLVAAAFYADSNLPCEKGLASEHKAEILFKGILKPHEECRIKKLVCVLTDRDYAPETIETNALAELNQAVLLGYEALKEEHAKAWAQKWELADVEIEGDDAAQQGIRFNLFHLLSTYTGDDERLNIGPKGFTGEKYGGATYWDTEAYCFPVYLGISGDKVARQLLKYRYLQLDGAYHNAKQQGLPGALFPMVTFNGIECHNEWEITFEEIHRNAAIAHAIFHYTTYTDDHSYLYAEGLDVLCGIARFFAGRVHRHASGSYMIHGVTGPNEYENNVNNNWYTNRMAKWCLEYFCDSLEKADASRQTELKVTPDEIKHMREIAEKMYLPYDHKRGIFVQHDTFLDKDLMKAIELPREDLPLNQNWSWDRILRSCFIKQADVLQGLYFLGHLYDKETKKRNFDFYEPMTVHESSLSPCVHAILAAEISYEDKAVEMYHKTARLDLDNLNRDTRDGLHITSMSGSWLAIAEGFAGLRTATGDLSLSPFLPKGWKRYAFHLNYRGRLIHIAVDAQGSILTLKSGAPLALTIHGQRLELTESLTIKED